MFETLHLSYAVALAAGGLGLAVLLALKLYSCERSSAAEADTASRALKIHEFT